MQYLDRCIVTFRKERWVECWVRWDTRHLKCGNCNIILKYTRPDTYPTMTTVDPTGSTRNEFDTYHKNPASPDLLMPSPRWEHSCAVTPTASLSMLLWHSLLRRIKLQYCQHFSNNRLG